MKFQRNEIRFRPARFDPRSTAFTASCLALATLIAPSLACRTASDTPAAPPAQALDQLVASRLHLIARGEIERQQLVGLSLVISRAGGIVDTVHFGWEDRELGIPTSDVTMYRLASISKPLTAVVAMQLAREGKLDLDGDVRAYVPEFPVQPFPISARELLCHQGGIVHYTNGAVVPTAPRANVAHPYEDAVDALATFAASPLVCEPGTQYSYSTHGYVLLGAVLQRASGTRFEDLVSRRVAEPLGMATLCADKSWVDIPHRTIGYRRDVSDAIVPSFDTDVSWKLAGGGFICCARDLARFGSGMLGDRVIDDESRERMWTQQATKSGAPTGYGLGFRVEAHQGRRLIYHGGSQEKTRTRLLILPEDDWIVTLMCNSEWADLEPLGRQLLDALLEAQ